MASNKKELKACARHRIRCHPKFDTPGCKYCARYQAGMALAHSIKIAREARVRSETHTSSDLA